MFPSNHHTRSRIRPTRRRACPLICTLHRVISGPAQCEQIAPDTDFRPVQWRKQGDTLMKKLLLIAALAGFALSAPAQVFAGEADCKDGEKWNEATQMCEKQDG